MNLVGYWRGGGGLIELLRYLSQSITNLYCQISLEKESDIFHFNFYNHCYKYKIDSGILLVDLKSDFLVK